MAEDYEKNGNKLVMDTRPRPSSDQLGPGVYISPKAGDWFPSPGKYVCALYADTTQWDPANKAWVPEKITVNFDTPSEDDEGCIPAWWMGNGTWPQKDCMLLSLCLPLTDLMPCSVAPEFGRSKYLTQIGGPGFTADNTVLISQIDMRDLPRTKLQMLIPGALLSGKNALRIRTECVKFDQSAGNGGADSFASIDKGVVDWSSWVNVKGVAQPMEPET